MLLIKLFVVPIAEGVADERLIFLTDDGGTCLFA